MLSSSTPTQTTINGEIKAGLYQIFTGSGTITGILKNKEIYPEWFGAVGDGTTDDTTAIQNTINLISAIGRGVLYLSSDTYLVTDTINGCSNIRIEGGENLPHVKNTSSADENVFSFSGHTNIYFRKVKLQNGAAATTGAHEGSDKNGVYVYDCDNVYFNKCEFTEMSGFSGALVRKSRNVHFNVCKFYRVTYSGLMIREESEDIFVRDCEFDTVTSTYYTESYLLATGASDYTNTYTFLCRNLHITGNKFLNNPRWEGIDSHGCLGFYCRDNYIENVSMGIMCSFDNRALVPFEHGDIHITGNTIIKGTGSAAYDGIVVKGNGTGDSVTFQDTGDTVTLVGHEYSDNDIVSFGSITTTTGISTSTSYFVVNASTDTFQVSDTLGGAAKTLTTNGTGVINNGGELASNVHIKDNKIYGEFGDATSIYAAGIRTTYLRDFEISGNTINGSVNKALMMYYCVFGDVIRNKFLNTVANSSGYIFPCGTEEGCYFINARDNVIENNDETLAIVGRGFYTAKRGLVKYENNDIKATTPYYVSNAQMSGSVSATNKVGRLGYYVYNTNGTIAYTCTDTNIKSIAATTTTTANATVTEYTVKTNKNWLTELCVGEEITIVGAGAGGSDLTTVIVNYVDKTTFTIRDAIGTTVSRAAINTLDSTWTPTFNATYSRTLTWDPASLNDGDGVTSADITLSGVELGDLVFVAPSYDLAGVTCTAYVKATDTINIRLQNESGGVVNLASGTWNIKVVAMQ